MKLRTLLIIICFFVGMTIKTVNAQYQPAGIIPEFTFQSLDGRLFSKKDLAHNRKMIFILFDVTCSHCQHEMEALGKHYDDFKNVAFYMVSMDTQSAIIQFMKSYGKQLYGKPNVKVLQDYKPEFVQKFMPDKYPAIFVYSERGALIKYLSGQKDVMEIVKAAR